MAPGDASGRLKLSVRGKGLFQNRIVQEILRWSNKKGVDPFIATLPHALVLELGRGGLFVLSKMVDFHTISPLSTAAKMAICKFTVYIIDVQWWP